ncbi:NADPH-dependent FMN reductase [Azospirillum sp. sgz301742]
MAPPIHVLGFAGSLRKASTNRSLLRVATEVVPEGMVLEVFDLSPIPLYNGDVEAAGLPEPVRDFRERIRAADALLIACPEYNYSIPGVLKNAIDWASRPPDQPFADKPLALMGAGGGLGTARSQYHLRQTCVFLDLHPLNKPELLVRNAESFNPDGSLKDGSVPGKVAALLTALAAWTRRLRGE